MRRHIGVVIATLIVLGVVIVTVVGSLDPRDLLSNTTTAGGDTGAHVAVAAYLRSNLLPSGHLTGWDPGWYDGFPLYTFYFPLPDLFAVLLGFIIPANIAFKIMTIGGSVALPISAWAFGRLAGLERPRPQALAAATLPFLFDQTWSIDGGNLLSTLAGEYSYSYGLSAALVFLGLVLYGLRTGRRRGIAAVVLAACVLCHLITTLFALAGAGLAWLIMGPSRRRTWWMVSTLSVAGLLTAWWWAPFLGQQAYTSSMGYTNLGADEPGIPSVAASMFPVADRWALVLAAAGVVVALVQRRRAIVLLGALGGLSGLTIWLAPQGKLYNARFLPLWFLCAYLLAGAFAAEVGVVFARKWRTGWNTYWRRQVGLLPARRRLGATDPPIAWPDDKQYPRRPRRPRWMCGPGAIVTPIVCIALASAVVLPDLLTSYQNPNPPSISVPLLGTIHVRHNNVRDWATWNFTGYQGKAGWPEYHALIELMGKFGKQYGCGRAMWEYSSDLDRFGTPMALMLLPMWTDGCVDSMEGLLFESAGTTPYHFLDQTELSTAPDDAMAGLDYGTLDVALGVQHLQMLGVKYFMASSPNVEAEAAQDPSLTLLDTSGPWNTEYLGSNIETTWKIYLVNNAAAVAPLTNQPVVLTGVKPSQPSWLPVSQKWYLDPSAWSTVLTAGGPSSWTREPASKVLDAPTRPLPPVKVSDIRVTADSVQFHVDRIGVPVEVRTSYFPDWHAQGAQGPWRATPNLMVVVPTSHDVSITYGSSPAGDLGAVLGVIGMVALVALFRRRVAFVVPRSTQRPSSFPNTGLKEPSPAGPNIR